MTIFLGALFGFVCASLGWVHGWLTGSGVFDGEAPCQHCPPCDCEPGCELCAQCRVDEMFKAAK